ncbi:MAG: tetratricopeptide repeat protein [Acidobacteria bacterium]|nr:MAG: tetratricopeptide repeat protein [Acidobacteriota bacterium]
MGRLRSLYLGRGNGVIDVATTALYVRDGELMLDRADPRAIGLADLLPADGSFAGDRPAVKQRMIELAQALAPDEARAREGRVRGAVELVGPLPTVYLLLELAVCGRDEEQLLEGLGGASATYQSSAQSPALEQLPGLDPEMGQVLMCLEQPMPIASLLKATGLERDLALRGLARLWAVGLVSSEAEAAVESMATRLLSARGLEHFRETIEESLASMPVDLPPAEHRLTIVEKWRSLGEATHYDLLELGRRADEKAVHAAYGRIARLVHPVHAARLGMEGRDEILKVLFERVTEAYLTLADPGRRVAYNQLLGLAAPVEEVPPDQRASEKVKLAELYYRRGVERLASLEPSVAIDLLKEAVRLDPKPEYFATLGLAQAKNPAWRRQAATSYERAVELAPGSAKFRVGLAMVLEKMKRRKEARQHYRKALELEPSNAQAQAGLDRLSGKAPPAVADDAAAG